MVECGYRAGWRIALGIGICALGLAACFSPGVQEGLACSESGSCPVGQVCVDSVCILAGTTGPEIEIDANETVPNADASLVDADNTCIDSVQCGGECQAQCITEITTAGESTFQPQDGCTHLRVDAWGAGGGHGDSSLVNGPGGAGAGGYALRELAVTSADSFTVVVGAPGTNALGATPGIGGAPGGGDGGLAQAGEEAGGGGGGFSGLFNGAVALGNEVVIGGGGGGSGGGPDRPDLTHGGAGGGEAGQFGSDEAPGSGGTQDSGHLQLQGGPGGGDSNDGGGGGGGGYWGGEGGNSANDDAQGGGGGSGYDGTLGCEGCVEGNRIIPGNAVALLGEMTALPTFPGKVVLTCSFAPPAP